MDEPLGTNQIQLFSTQNQNGALNKQNQFMMLQDGAGSFVGQHMGQPVGQPAVMGSFGMQQPQPMILPGQPMPVAGFGMPSSVSAPGSTVVGPPTKGPAKGVPGEFLIGPDGHPVIGPSGQPYRLVGHIPGPEVEDNLTEIVEAEQRKNGNSTFVTLIVMILFAIIIAVVLYFSMKDGNKVKP